MIARLDRTRRIIDPMRLTLRVRFRFSVYTGPYGIHYFVVLDSNALMFAQRSRRGWYAPY